MDKKCTECGETKDVSLFYRRYDKGPNDYRNQCKKCLSEKKYGKLEKPRTVYKSDQERVIAARKRSKDWYATNTGRAKERIAAWSKTEHGKAKCKESLARRKANNPEYWRRKKKRDKAIRRAREYGAGELHTSSISVLESYNYKNFGKGEFVCEYCKSLLGSDYHMEHVVALSNGGKNTTDNLAISCDTCNLQKGVKLIEDWNPEAWDYLQNRKL